VLTTGPDGQYLINFKSNRAEEGAHLARFLDGPGYMSRVFGVYGGVRPTQAAVAARDDLRGFDKPALKACLLSYFAIGWTGKVPDACSDTLIAVPVNYGPYLGGWPHRFTQRMKAAGTEVILWGPYDGTGFSSGIDDAEALANIPEQFDGYVWTNRIEVTGPLLKPGAGPDAP
jgi:glycerophosphoryl diester phosphodiesterase